MTSSSSSSRRRVAGSRAIPLDPKVILLDEPSIGLDPRSRKLVFASISALAAGGRTVLLVEQNARSGLAVSDVGVVLEAGMVRLVASAASLLDDPEVARLYLGAAAVPGALAPPYRRDVAAMNTVERTRST